MTIYDVDPAVGSDGFGAAGGDGHVVGGRLNSAADSAGAFRAVVGPGFGGDDFPGNPYPLVSRELGHLDPFEFFTPGDEAVEPDWVFEAAAERLRGKLAASAVDAPNADYAAVLERACPSLVGLGPNDATGRRVGVGEAVDLSAAELLHGVVGWQRIIGWAQSMQQQYIAALAQPGVIAPLPDLIDIAASPLGFDLPVPDLPEKAIMEEGQWGRVVQDVAIKLASAEIGCALGVSPITARRRTEEAVYVTGQLPAVHRAQIEGRIDGYRASIIAERTVVLDPELRAVAAEAVLSVAAARAPGRLRALVDREVIRLDPEAAARRETEARTGRGTRVVPDPDGMAAFIANLPAADALMAQGVLDRIATAVTAAGLAAGRGQSQLRADAFTALFTDLARTGHFTITSNTTDRGSDASSRLHRPPICVNVYVTAETLAGWSDEPAEINGYGAITAETARDLARSAAAVRTITISRRDASRAGPPPDGPPGDQVPRSRPPDAEPARLIIDGAEPDDAGAEGGRCKGSSLTARRIGYPRSPAALAATAVTPTASELGHQSVSGRPVAAGHSDNPARSSACGTVLNVGRIRYRPPERTIDHVGVRDRVCTFPNCATQAARCDIDHRQPFTQGPSEISGGAEGGATCPCNLDLLCRFHHLIKTFTDWTGAPSADGTLAWTSPVGNTYSTEPGHILLDSAAATSAAAAISFAASASTISAAAGADEPPPF